MDENTINTPENQEENLPEAYKMANSVICLPMHHEVKVDDIDRVLELIIR